MSDSMRRAPRLPLGPALALALVGALALPLMGCDGIKDRVGGFGLSNSTRDYAAPPAVLGSTPGGPAPVVAAATPAPAGAVVAPNAPYAAPVPEGRTRDNAALALSCRRAADDVLARRDRGALMREDERDSRLGTDASIYSLRVPIDRMGRQFERDRMAQDCVQQNAH